MSIIGIPNTRVSDLFVRQRLLDQIQSDQLELLRLQVRLSTGRRYDLPSDEPVAASRAMTLQRLLERKDQVRSNLGTSQSYLSATDSALSEVSGLLTDARGAALSVIGTTASDTQRLAAAQQVRQALSQLVNTANINFRGRYLFAGSETGTLPFQPSGNNVVRYDGNESRMSSFSDLDLLFDTNLQGNEVFGTISDPVRGSTDLDPALTWNTRLADLRGGQGIRAGSIALSDGVETKILDVTRAETVGDLARILRAGAPKGRTLNVDVTSRGLVLQLTSGSLSIGEVGGGRTAHDLGIDTATPVGTAPLVGANLNPVLRATTRLDEILGARARAVLRPPLGDNDIVIEAKTPGSAPNGVTVSLFDDHTVTATHEVAQYDPVARTLKVNIENGRTRAIDVINAVNHAVPPVPFTARLDPLDDRFGGEGLIDSGTTAPATTSGGWGTSFDRNSGIQVVNGGKTYVINFTSAQTIEDVLGALNNSGAGLLAEINAAGTGIDVRSRLSGTALAIGENGGRTAAQLGIRSFTNETRLADLNFGRGVGDAPASTEGVGPDFRITSNDGAALDIDVHGAKTVGDVLSLINNDPANRARAVPLVARLARYGNGIELSDNSVGTHGLSIERLNLSTAAIDLGLVPSGRENASSSSAGRPYVLTGTDVNLQETDGVFTALARLADGLERNDLEQVNRAVVMLDRRTVELNFARAELGARQQALDVLDRRLEDENVELRSSLSDDFDADLAETISDLTGRQYAYQAALQATANISKLSLLNYL